LAPTTAAPFFPYPNCEYSESEALDCRHGRVLLYVRSEEKGWSFLVWDPVTGDRQQVPDVCISSVIYTAAVICAVSGCDHLDCHGGPFRVVFLASDNKDVLIKASVYSSETGAWSVPVCLAESSGETFVQPRRAALIGDDIYFVLRLDNAIIKYDSGKNCLSVINPPKMRSCYITLMVMEDSSLGFACIRSSSLYLWSRKVNSSGAAEWVQCRVIELDGMVPIANPDDKQRVAGFAEGVGIIFMSTGVGLFMIKLNSGRVRKVGEPGFYFSVLPYMSFYTPGTILDLAYVLSHAFYRLYMFVWQILVPY
ncbi:hypothetical protein EJB05_14338, partial [Eragrostis curvula]